ITPTDQPPTLVGFPPVPFQEGGGGIILNPAPLIIDPDSTTLTSATLAITGGTFVGDGDTLTFSTAGTSITASYDSTTETLLLTGADTITHYDNVLKTVAFSTPSHNPTNYGSDPNRTVVWTLADDFNVHSAPVTSTINIGAVNDAPTLSSVTPS